MKARIAIPLAVGMLCFVGCADRQAQAQTGTDGSLNPGTDEQQKLVLTPAQRHAIYDAVNKDKSKTAKVRFPPTIGAEVPPMIELYALPDQVLAKNHTLESYEYTVEQDKVVLVDPTRMRVVDIIGPNSLP